MAGTVVSGDAASTPVRRARVMLARTDGAFDATTATTDDAGRFEFRSLPAGRVTIDAMKPGFLRASYGATKPSRDGTPVSVGDGQRVAGLTIRLVRGSAIGETVRDARGRPLPDVQVSAWRLTYSGYGERTLLSAPGVATDDRGVYRIWGLPAGEYLVVASPVVGLPNGPGSGDFHRLSAAQVDRILALPRGISTGAPSDAIAPTSETRSGGAPTVNYAPVFHPGSPNPDEATFITVKEGADLVRVDIAVGLVPTAHATGRVTRQDNLPPVTTTITLAATGELTDIVAIRGVIRTQTQQVGADGRFEFRNVVPGRYALLARTEAIRDGASASAGAVPPSPLLWAQATVDVNGGPVDVPLVLQPSMTATGRIVFEGESAPPADVTGLSIRLIPPGSGGYLGAGPMAMVKADRTFTLTGVAPGPYRVVQLFQTRWTEPWTTKAILANGRDALDGLVVAPGENIDLVLTYTDRPTEITGTLQSAGGRPAPEYFIVVFPADQRLWRTATRLSSVRPGDGVFSVKHLPPGDYLLAALTDFRFDDFYEPSFLADVAPLAVQVSVREG